MIRSSKVLSAFVAVLVFAATGQLNAEETKGKVHSMDAAKGEVVLKGTIKNTLYELNKDATVWLDGAKSKLADLKVDDTAVIAYEKRGEHFMASEVRGLRNAQEATGTVRGTFSEKKEITLKGVVKDTTYELAKDATVALNGKEVSLNDLRADDYVMITYMEQGKHYMAKTIRASRK